MRQHRSSKSSLFLLEMMISILFFAIVSAVCVQVFVKAHQMSVEAENLHMAQSCAVSAAELLKTRDAKTALEEFYPGSEVSEGHARIGFTSEWTPFPAGEAKQEEASFGMTIDWNEDDRMRTGEIVVCDPAGEELYTIPVRHYLQRDLQEVVQNAQ